MRPNNRPGFRPQQPKVQTPIQPGSHAGAQMHDNTQDGEAASQERPNVTHGEASPRMFPGELRDTLWLSDADKKAYGIEGAIPSTMADTDMPGDRIYMAIRNPEYYGPKDTGHLRQVKRKWASFKPVIDPETNKPVDATADAVYITVSREEYMQHMERHQEAVTQFTGGVIDGGVTASSNGQSEFVENFRGNDPNFIQRKYMEAHSTLSSPGFRTNWPKQMSISEIEAKIGVEETMKLERKFARNGRTERPGEYENYEQALRESNKRRSDRTKSVSFPGQATK